MVTFFVSIWRETRQYQPKTHKYQPKTHQYQQKTHQYQRKTHKYQRKNDKYEQKKTKIIFLILYKYNFSHIFASALFIAYKKVISKIIILVY